MLYPKQMYPMCISLQHFVLNIIDGQKVPDVVKSSTGYSVKAFFKGKNMQERKDEICKTEDSKRGCKS